MRLAAKIVGVLVFLIGIVWTLQGINIMQGSPMSGDPFWAITGIVCLIVGGILAFVGFRRVVPTTRT